MFNNDYSFCGCTFRLSSTQPLEEQGNYGKFRCDRSVEHPDYCVRVIPTHQLPQPTGTPSYVTHRRTYYDKEGRVYTAFYDLCQYEKISHACKLGEDELWIRPLKDALIENAVFDGLDLPAMLLNKGIGLLHCSFVAYRRSALLFAGDKQVGKSTQAALWQTHKNAPTVNGDRAGIYQKDGVFFAGGVPYAGTSGICHNKNLPIKAIVCLGKGAQNTLEQCSAIDGFKELLGKFSYNHRPTETEQIVSLVSSLVEKVPVYRYSCVKDESAVDFLEQQLF